MAWATKTSASDCCAAAGPAVPASRAALTTRRSSTSSSARTARRVRVSSYYDVIVNQEVPLSRFALREPQPIELSLPKPDAMRE